MAEGEPLSREAFLILAEALGIDASGAHGEELLAFVRNTHATLEALKDMEVLEAEPDMAFLPRVG